MDTQQHKLVKKIPVLLFITCLLAFSIFFYFVSPDTLIAYIGVSNAYFLIFILALIGGLTTFSGVPYHFVLIALATGGMNPWLLGLTTGFGVILGDSTSYYIGYRGREILSDKIHAFLGRIMEKAMRYPKLLPFFFLLYASFIPLSNDFLVISSGLAKYPFWKVIVPLAIGNIFFNTMLALFAAWGFGFVTAFA